MAYKKIGQQSVRFEAPPRLVAGATIAGKMEDEGRFAKRFDLVLEDDFWGEKTWERAERKIFEQSVRLAVRNGGLTTGDLDVMLGGDLLNQLISANYAARELSIPFLGLYGACSAMSESLLIGSMLIESNFFKYAACVAGSHFSTAERQFRMPLEMGNQVPPTAQRTVTGAGCTIIAAQGVKSDSFQFQGIRVTGGTIGRVIDYGITDTNNMGAAMAPAAADTIFTHLKDMGRNLDDYDLVITGDLGRFGTEMLYDLLKERGIDITGKHTDCGLLMFLPEQKVNCGASGSGCAALALNSYFLKRLEAGEYRRILFAATGALMSPISSMQGDSIPGICHGVVLEGENV